MASADIATNTGVPRRNAITMRIAKGTMSACGASA